MSRLKQVLCALILTFSVVAGTTAELSAQIPRTILYQGRLTDPAGLPLTGTFPVKFEIYSDPNVGRWFEMDTITCVDGLFSTILGTKSFISTNMAYYVNPLIGVTIGGDPELTPRQTLSCVPFSLFTYSLEGTRGGGITSAITVDDSTSGNPAVTGAGWEVGGKFTCTQLSPETRAVDAEVLGTGQNYDATAVFGHSLPSSYHGYGGDFEGGYTGCRGTGLADPSTGDYAYGVVGQVPNPSGTGVLGGAMGGHFYAANAGSNFGVYAMADNGSGYSNATAYAVYARAYTGHGLRAWAAYLDGSAAVTGDLTVYGTLTKSGGAFRIDHPLDPENKYLQHSFVESPDMKDIYDGVAILDNNGEATVTMPDWFQALNQDFRYQLTPIGAPGPNLYISKEVANNQFSIAGGKPGMKVSWTVTGIRHDPYANANRIQVEVDKRPEERGKYIAPAAYGLGPDKFIHADVTAQADAQQEALSHHDSLRPQREINK